MKTCRKCKTEKDEGEFYRHNDCSDGLDSWCKVCRYADTKNRVGKTNLPYSTERAIQLLSDNGIPATVGYIVGRPGKDIVAYGYLTVEAKSAVVRGASVNGYTFGLTSSQKVLRCDYYILICRDTERVFVVPGTSEVLTLNGTALYVNATDMRIAQFENAWDIIKARALHDIQKSEPIKSVMTMSGGRYRQVTSA